MLKSPSQTCADHVCCLVHTLCDVCVYSLCACMCVCVHVCVCVFFFLGGQAKIAEEITACQPDLPDAEHFSVEDIRVEFLVVHHGMKVIFSNSALLATIN